MSNEVIIKKADGEFLPLIPEMGIVEKSSSAEKAYDQALARRQEVESAFQTAGAGHLLLAKNAHQLEVRVWSTRFKQWMGISLALYFVGLLTLGFVVTRSFKRMADSVRLSVVDPDPKRIDKNIVKFREFLVKYRPFIDEWNKANKTQDKN